MAEFKVILIIPNSEELPDYGYGRLISELKEGWGVVDSHWIAEQNTIYFVVGREIKEDA